MFEELKAWKDTYRTTLVPKQVCSAAHPHMLMQHAFTSDVRPCCRKLRTSQGVPRAACCLFFAT